MVVRRIRVRPERQRRRDNGFDEHADPDDAVDHRAYVSEPGRPRLGSGVEPGLESDPVGEYQSDERGHRHDPESAGLDQREDDALSEPGPVDGGVDDDQSGQAHGGGRGEQGLDDGGLRAGPGRCRDEQQDRTDDDRRGEAQRHDSDRGEGGLRREPAPQCSPCRRCGAFGHADEH